MIIIEKSLREILPNKLFILNDFYLSIYIYINKYFCNSKFGSMETIGKVNRRTLTIGRDIKLLQELENKRSVNAVQILSVKFSFY